VFAQQEFPEGDAFFPRLRQTEIEHELHFFLQQLQSFAKVIVENLNQLLFILTWVICTRAADASSAAPPLPEARACRLSERVEHVLNGLLARSSRQPSEGTFSAKLNLNSGKFITHFPIR
jgi:hypothetical protein